MKTLLLMLCVCSSIHASDYLTAVEGVRHACRYPYRVVDGQTYDLSTVFAYGMDPSRWTNEKRPPSDWSFLYGKVVQVETNGVIFQPIGLKYWTDNDLRDPIFFENHPKIDIIVDGNFLADFAVETGRYQYLSTAGAVRTLRKFDFGRIATTNEIAELREKKERMARLAAEKRSIERQLRQLDAEEKARLMRIRVVAFQKEQATNGFGVYQYELGLRYLRGDGLETNRDLARFWLMRAQTNGYPNATTNLPTFATK